ncbi:MAG: methionyl-tRNA formyltransferase [Candidatus Eisenbacteria bacterium]
MRIVFMGTPEFAVPSLRSLHEAGHDVSLVVTQPDRPAGRGRKLRAPAVKAAALELGLPVEQYESVNTAEFTQRLGALRPDLLVVVAFGQILKQGLLDVPTSGAVNVHASLLPAYRGTSPINWVIVNGEAETGVTTMFMAGKVDAGEIILKRKTPIGDMETAGELSDRLATLGAALLVETVALIERGEAPRAPQNPDESSYVRKLRKSDGEIDWSEPARGVLDRIRGMTPWPGAYTWYKGRALRVERAEPGSSGPAGAPSAAGGGRPRPGEILSLDEGAIEVAAGDGAVRLLEVRPEGKGSMSADAFVRGYRPEVGTRPFAKEA